MHFNLAIQLERLYHKYNCRRFVHPDPLEFLYHYDNPADREIAAIIASSLAYGNVKQILKSVSSVLEVLNPSPSITIAQLHTKQLREMFTNFRHRFTTGRELSNLLINVKKITEEYGTLNSKFLQYYKANSSNIKDALYCFAKQLSPNRESPTLIPDPEKNSALKRLNLFLRWMVRQDNIDPGGWTGIPTSKLIIPLDTHMFRIGRILEFTKRKQSNLQSALEITSCFAEFAPEDPVKFDFALTRLGITKETSYELFAKTKHITTNK